MSDKREARTNAVRVALALRARMPALTCPAWQQQASRLWCESRWFQYWL